MKFVFTLSVWADWHVNQFFKNALPSLRAPGNLDSVDYRISVHTCPCDVEGLRKALAGLVYDVEATLPDNITSDRNAAHPVVSRFKEEDRAAAGDGDVWLLLAPDMVWAQGTLAYYRHLFEQGKKAIFRPLLRVDSDKAGTIADFSNRALAKVALESEHDLVKKFYRASGPHFSRHAEMVTWEAPGGLVNQTITAEMQVCLAKLELFGPHNLAPDLSPDEMAVIRDSDEGITLAMMASNADVKWLDGAMSLTPRFVEDFLRWYPSPASRHIASRPYRLHAKDIDAAEEPAWREVERRAKALIEEGIV